MARIIIIGAGLTGISTAYHLEQLGFSDYLMFEKETSPGGLCRSVSQDGFTFDYTGHLLHASDDYFYQLICDLVGLEQMNVIDRRSYVYSHETFTHYPFQINLHGLPHNVIIECITEFVNRQKNDTPLTFKEWVDSNFGTGFGNHFFYTYQEKIFAHDINNITASWTGRFVPKTSLEDMLHGSLTNEQKPVGYNARFLYPKRGGIYSWISPFVKRIKKPIITGSTINTIDMNKKIITCADGTSEPYDLLINTMPLDRMLSCLIQKPSLSLNQAARYLKCNNVVNFNLGINRPDISDKHWVYFPEKKYPFYRLGFWHNFSSQMAPPGHSSLYGEFAHMQQSPERVEQTLAHSIQQTKKLFAIADQDIVTQKVMHISHAYVTYDHWREQHLPALLDRLASENIYSVGRYGAWKYSSMQEAVLDGKKTAQKALSKLDVLPPSLTPHITQEIPAHE